MKGTMDSTTGKTAHDSPQDSVPDPGVHRSPRTLNIFSVTALLLALIFIGFALLLPSEIGNCAGALLVGFGGLYVVVVRSRRQRAQRKKKLEEKRGKRKQGMGMQRTLAQKLEDDEDWGVASIGVGGLIIAASSITPALSALCAAQL